jgi:hypothetical protein
VKVTLGRRLEDSPWARRQFGALVGLNGAGLLLLVVAWHVTAHQALLGKQLGWLSVGVVAVLVAAAADVRWLAAGRHALLVRRREVLADQPAVAASSPRSVTSTTDWVQVPGGTRAHRPGCLLIVGKDVRTVQPARLRKAGRRLRPCEVCTR